MDCAKKALTDSARDNGANPDKFKEVGVGGHVMHVGGYFTHTQSIKYKLPFPALKRKCSG